MQTNSEILKCLEFDETNPRLLPYLDEVLSLVAEINRQNSSDDSALNALSNKMGKDKLRDRIERYVSKTYLEQGDSVQSTLFSQCTAESAKVRYRKLISLFHPDKGVNDQAWLNHRSEIINKTYESFKAGKFNNSTSSVKTNTPINKQSNNFASPQYSKKAKHSSKNSFIHKFSGQHEKFKSRLYKGLIATFLALVGLVYLSAVDFDKVKKTNEKVSKQLVIAEKEAKEKSPVSGAKPDDSVVTVKEVTDKSLANQIAKQKALKLLSLKKEKEKVVASNADSFKNQQSKYNIDSSFPEKKLVALESNLSTGIVKPTPINTIVKADSSADVPIAFADTASAWVYKKFLDIDNSIGIATVNANRIRVREEPTTKKPNVIGVVNKGDVLEIISIQDRWCEVIFKPVSTLDAKDFHKQQSSGAVPSAPEIEVVEEQQSSAISTETQIQIVNIDNASQSNKKISTSTREVEIDSLSRQVSTELFDRHASNTVVLEGFNDSKKTKPIDALSVKQLLTTYRQSFVRGDSKRLGSLYLPLAEEGGLTGRSKIIDRYKQLFAQSTGSLQISMSAPSVAIDGDKAIVKVKMTPNQWYQSLFAGAEMPVDIVVVNTSSGLRISNFETIQLADLVRAK